MIDRYARMGGSRAARRVLEPLLGSALLLSLLAGCASSSVRTEGGDPPEAANPLADNGGAAPAELPEGTSLEDMMARAMAGMEQYEAGVDPNAGGVPRGVSVERRPTAEADPVPTVSISDLAAEESDEVEAADGPQAEDVRTFNDVARELAQLAAERMIGSTDPIADALVLAALEAAVDGQGRWLGGRTLAGLSPDERLAAEAVRTAISDIQRGTNAADALEHAASIVGQDRRLTIARAALCTRVEGFGRYDPFPRDVFLAGRRLRMLVYTEIDGFHAEAASMSGGDPGWQVELSQELLLYHDADGTLAWQQPPRTSQYRARTRPRDYFVVNQVTLPANLTIGSYHLKVVMTDRATGAVDEAILPIQVVADAKLANRP